MKKFKEVFVLAGLLLLVITVSIVVIPAVSVDSLRLTAIAKVISNVYPKDKSKMEIPDWAKSTIKVESKSNKVITIKYPWDMPSDEIAPSITIENVELEIKSDRIIFKGTVEESLGKGNIIEGDGEMTVSGILKKELKESSFKYKSDFGIGLEHLSGMKGLDVKTVNTEKAELLISKHGLLLKGRLSLKDGASFYAGVEFKGKVDINAHFNHDFSDWYLKVDASDAESFTMFKVPLKANEEGVALRLWPKGIDVKALFDLGPAGVKMEGRIDSKDVKITGDIDVDLPLKLAGHVVDQVTDGAICGYEIVTDGTICGYQTVTSAAKCGTEEVADAAKCGYKTVTNAEKCGEEVITSAVKCGTHRITNGAKCGWDTVGCWINPFRWGSCKEAESCKVAKSCKIAKTCKIVASCDVPKTCKDYDAPKSCQDLNKPKTCERHHLGDYVGDIRGDLKLKVSEKGLGISADAKYCAKKECDKLEAKATYHAKHPMQICFDIEVLHGFKNAEGKACANLNKIKK
jgi:hypothetical protein